MMISASNNHAIKFMFSTLTEGIVTYEDVKRVSENNKGDILLIDVREPQELVETGTIPNSVNIPCKMISKKQICIIANMKYFQMIVF